MRKKPFYLSFTMILLVLIFIVSCYKTENSTAPENPLPVLTAASPELGQVQHSAFKNGLTNNNQISVNGVLIKALEFNVDGVLPPSEPDIVLYNNTGAPENSLYSVSGGFLQQRTLNGSVEVVGNASYLFPNSVGGQVNSPPKLN